MKKSKMIAGLSAAVAVTCALGILTACGHEHTFSDEWYNQDPVYHWHAATCEHKDEVSDKAEHTFNGSECTVCHYSGITADDSYGVTTLLCGNTRIQLLSDSLVRIEDKADGAFEDRASYTVQNRSGSGVKVEYQTNKTDTGYEIVTDNYTVVIPAGSKAAGVTVADANGETVYKYLGDTGSNVWLPSPSDELSSWYFTDSPRVIPSECGYSPREDYVPLQGWEFDEGVTDIYVFVPRGDYKTFTTDFVTLTGQSEMITLKCFGFWDSRYYAYNEDTALQQISNYIDKGYSIDVFVVDTDWRSTSGGWGYDINLSRFPNMERFLDRAHELGANIVFNDHPQPVDGTSNLLDDEEVSYRNEKLTMLLAMGMDYWWYDRNWAVALDPVSDDVSRYATGMYAYQWITKEYYESLVEEGNVEEYARRALILANVDGCEHGAYGYASDLSAHRYSMQWTGDISCGPEWLEQEIAGAVMAGAELGLPYISADLGGHTGDPGNNSPEWNEYGKLYSRWMQYGMLSSVSRLHYWACDGRNKAPWNFNGEVQEIFRTYEDMRYRLLPLFYASAHENYETGLPILRRLDIGYPQYAEANRNDEYLLGDYILIAPISSYTGSDSRTVFLPEGSWIDVWTGTRYSGPATIDVTHGLKTSPVFVREGALIALAENMTNVDEKNWSNMALEVYPSANYSAKTTVYEDDTQTVAYKDGKFRTTDITMNCSGNTLKINIGAAKGSFTGDRAFANRTWNIRLHTNPNWGAISSVKVNGTAVTPDTLAKLTYEAGGRPFAFTGGALDGDVTVFTIQTEVAKAYEIEIVYASVADSAMNSAYDKTAVGFKISAKLCSGDSVDLTETGTTDWVAYGHMGGTSVDRKKDGGALFSEPTTFLGCNVTNFKPNNKNGLIYRDYTDGAQRYPSTGTSCATVRTGFRFSVRTTGAKEQIVLYLGGAKTIAKLTVRDRAGNVQTIQLGGRGNADFAYQITIDCAAGEAGTLYFEYQAQAGKFHKLEGTHGNTDIIDSSVELYCGYIKPAE